MILTVVYDNNPYREGLETAWGFSCVIETSTKTILFDTGGSGRLLLENMSKTGIDPHSIEIVVLSHRHGDHTGGLEMFLKQNSHVSVFVPQSFPKNLKEKIHTSGAELIEVDQHTQICKNVYSTGQMGTLIKEQALVLSTEKGLVVITGCAHPGIFKMTQAAKNTLNKPILLVMGGFHLEWASKNKIEKIITAFKEMDVKYTAPCHCSGNKARTLFAKHFGDHYIKTGLGKVLKTEDL